MSLISEPNQTIGFKRQFYLKKILFLQSHTQYCGRRQFFDIPFTSLMLGNWQLANQSVDKIRLFVLRLVNYQLPSIINCEKYVKILCGIHGTLCRTISVLIKSTLIIGYIYLEDTKFYFKKY